VTLVTVLVKLAHPSRSSWTPAGVDAFHRHDGWSVSPSAGLLVLTAWVFVTLSLCTLITLKRDQICVSE